MNMTFAQGGRGHWTVNDISTQSLKTHFLNFGFFYHVQTSRFKINNSNLQNG